MVDKNEQTITNADLLKLLNIWYQVTKNWKNKKARKKNEILNLKNEFNKEIDDSRKENI